MDGQGRGDMHGATKKHRNRINSAEGFVVRLPEGIYFKEFRF